jgi:FMN-dependent oxidoreductase (nitrilotriacetate monooxygenase family)
MRERSIRLIGFLHAEHGSIFTPSWRHRDAATDFTTPDYFRRIARVLEEGKYHMAFFDDRLAIPDIYGRSHEAAVAGGVRAVKMDPIPVLAIMAAATKRLGLGATGSTTYYEPFHIARTFATLDLMSEGRAAWNVVTSLNDSEAANFGREEHLEHDERYDRADEFMEVVLGLWRTWEDDALVQDKRGLFADPKKVHVLAHQGRFFKSRGPLPVPRSPQGHPVIIQAGQSGRGREFAARWGEVIFTTTSTVEAARKNYKATKEAIAAQGRDPDTVTIAPMTFSIVAGSDAEAEDRLGSLRGLARPDDGPINLAELLNFDFSSKRIDEPLTDEEMAEISGGRAFLERIKLLSGKSHPSLADCVRFTPPSSLRGAQIFAGSPKTIADTMEEWFTTGVCDGFVTAATCVPGSYEDFARLVVPELQRRRLFRRDFEGATLRENLGLPSGVAVQ